MYFCHVSVFVLSLIAIFCICFDLNSLYPHLIMQYNISPETLREARCPSASVERILNQETDIDGTYAVCANGAQYRKDIRGFLPELMEKMYNERVIFKRRLRLLASRIRRRRRARALRCSASFWIRARRATMLVFCYAGPSVRKLSVDKFYRHRVR